jgi:hypothetical protein
MRKARVFTSFLGVVLLGCMSLAIPAYGQSDVGTIVGFVRDQSGAIVPGASVTIRNEGNATEQTVTTDAQGRYTAPNLPPADYAVTIEAKGFKKFNP